MKTSDIQTIGVIGAGQMGSGIAQVASMQGCRVILCDLRRELSDRAKDKISSVLEKMVAKGKMVESDRAAALARIEPAEGPGRLAEADFVIEAATEEVATKIAVLRDADRLMQDHAILASNTSSIPITELAAAVARSDRVIGMHFMNPVPLMKLVELVCALQTSTDTYETTQQLAHRLGKTTITSKDRPGFVVNRLLLPLLNEACFALEEGLASVEDIDSAVKLGLNHPMGPLELADLVGLDTVLSIAELLHRELGEDKYRPCVLLRSLVAAGFRGKKTGRGFYVYEANGQKVRPSL